MCALKVFFYVFIDVLQIHEVSLWCVTAICTLMKDCIIVTGTIFNNDTPHREVVPYSLAIYIFFLSVRHLSFCIRQVENKSDMKNNDINEINLRSLKLSNRARFPKDFLKRCKKTKLYKYYIQLKYAFQNIMLKILRVKKNDLM